MNTPRTSVDPHTKTRKHGRYIKSMIYGGIDGVITTFAVIAGGSGADLTHNVLFVLGIANLLADGFSMGFGDFISSRAENEFRKKETIHEEFMLETNPKDVKDQIKNMYTQKGFNAHEAETVAQIFSKNKSMVVSLFLAERGIFKIAISPVTKSLYTFFSFIFFGAIPLFTYLLLPHFDIVKNNTFLTACILTGFTLFFLGSFKTRFTDRHWIVSGIEMIFLGGVSACIAYMIGVLLGHLI